MELKQLCIDAHAISLEKGWYNPPPTIEGRLILMHSEISEAVEEYRNGERLDAIRYDPSQGAGLGKPEGIPIELADIIIRVADFCGWAQIDLEKAVAMKMEYNRTREYRHGGKAL